MVYRILIAFIPIPFVIFLWSGVEQLAVISDPIRIILSVIAALLTVAMLMDDEIIGDMDTEND